MKQCIVILTDRLLHNGPRIIREVEGLINDFEIETVGKTPTKIKSVGFTAINSLFGRYSILDRVIIKLLVKLKLAPYYKFLAFKQIYLFRKYLLEKKPAVIIIHDVEFFPVVFFIKKYFLKNVKVVFNAHEYHPLEGTGEHFNKNIKPMFEYYYNNFIGKLDLLVNVCESINQLRKIWCTRSCYTQCSTLC
jgi:hypothetical protein